MVAAIALFLTMMVYLTFSYMSIKYFGVQNIRQNIFENFSRDFDPLSQMLKLLFLVIFFCALPFNLHPLKVCILNIIEEVRARRISKSLNSKLTFVKGEEQSDEFVREIDDDTKA